jgi:hypothetical protein
VGTSWIHSLVSLCFTEEHASLSEDQWRASSSRSLPSINTVSRLREQSPGNRKQELISHYKSSGCTNLDFQGLGNIYVVISRHTRIDTYRRTAWSVKAVHYCINLQGNKTDCSNYCGTSLSTSYKILLNILLSRLSPYMYEITGDHQCGFQWNRSTTNWIFCSRKVLEPMIQLERK